MLAPCDLVVGPGEGVVAGSAAELLIGRRKNVEEVKLTLAGKDLVIPLDMLQDRGADALGGCGDRVVRGEVVGQPVGLDEAELPDDRAAQPGCQGSADRQPVPGSQARKMYDDRELTVEQIGAVLGVSRTSIYRALGHTAALAPPATPAPSGAVEPAAVKADTAEAPVAALPTPAPATGAPPAVRARGRSRWFVVQADPADPEHGPVAVLSGHTSQKAATAALGRARRRAWSGAGEGSVLQVRAAEQISSRLVWDPQAGRGVVHPGPPP